MRGQALRKMDVGWSMVREKGEEYQLLNTTYHKPYEVMLVCRPGALKKAPKLCDINLISGSLPI